MAEARRAYARREITYPIDFAIDMTSAMLQQDPQRALEQFCTWVKSKYELDWHPQMLPSSDPMELKRLLLAEAEKWDEAQICERAERAVAAGSSPDQLDEWFQKHASARLTAEERTRAEDDPQSVAEEKIAAVLRAELTQFERWVLLQIVDQTWKDHLHSMDQIRESIGFRSFRRPVSLRLTRRLRNSQSYARLANKSAVLSFFGCLQDVRLDWRSVGRQYFAVRQEAESGFSEVFFAQAPYQIECASVRVDTRPGRPSLYRRNDFSLDECPVAVECGHENRLEPGFSALDNRVSERHSSLPQNIYVVDEYNCIVDNDTKKKNQTDAGG